MESFKIKLLRFVPKFCFVFFIGSILCCNVHMPVNFFVPDQEETHFYVKVSEVFDIYLECNMSTGFTWLTPNLNENCQEVIRFIGRKYVEQSKVGRIRNGGGLLGAPGYDVFRFEALAPGEAAFELNYCQPWEKDVPPAKVRKIFIHVSR